MPVDPDSEDIIQKILDGRHPQAGPAETTGVTTRSVVIRESIDGLEAVLVSALGIGPRLAVVSDPETDQALGARVRKALGGSFRVEHVPLRSEPAADLDTVRWIRHRGRRSDAIVAVGSGTINDLCKYAAHLDRKPYVVFGTAPSMNGYVSENASISVGGVKKTLPASAPLGAFLDLSVLARAPRRLIIAGLGDCLCRPTAQADWLLSHLVLDTPYSEMPFSLVAEEEEPLFACSAALLNGDTEAMHQLARVLTLSGFGMALCKTSAPASQGEHLISHYLEMFWPGQAPKPFHGEQVAVTTLTMAGLQERILERDSLTVHPESLGNADFRALFGRKTGQEFWTEFERKRLSPARAEALAARLAAEWEAIRSRISSISRSRDFLYAVLKNAEGPTRPEELGIRGDFYDQAVNRARLVRNRFTFLDLAAASGLLEMTGSPS